MMDRREFISRSAAVIAASRLSRYETLASQIAANKRVGIIGPGWYGKSDLLRMVQVAPVNVVSMCDVDSRMLNDAADLVATRQVSKKRPRLYSDWRRLLAEKDLDIVLIDTPDHWHALPMIEAVKSGLDVWVQKPISVDVVEGQAMLAAARKYGRVVQVGMQRRSTPHLVDGARSDHPRGEARQHRLCRDLLLLPHARDATIRPTRRRRRSSTTRCGPGRRRCGRSTR